MDDLLNQMKKIFEFGQKLVKFEFGQKGDKGVKSLVLEHFYKIVAIGSEETSKETTVHMLITEMRRQKDELVNSDHSLYVFVTRCAGQYRLNDGQNPFRIKEISLLVEGVYNLNAKALED